MASTTFVPADREEILVAGDGVKLHVAHFQPKGTPIRNLVAVHGFTTYSAPYGHFFTRLAELGVAVTTFDCRGHGRSGGQRGYVRRFEVFHDDLALVVAAAQTNFPQLPWALLGHSHGGTIAIDAVLAGKLKPERLVLAAPWLGLLMKVTGWKMAMSGLMSRLWPTLALDNEIKPEHGSRNPAVIDAFWKDANIHHVAAARWFTEVLAAQARIRDTGASLSVPTLLLSAGGDRVVDNQPIDALATAAPRFVQAKRYEGLYHELFLEPEWQDVLSDVARFLTAPTDKQAQDAGAGLSLPAILPSPP